MPYWMHVQSLIWLSAAQQLSAQLAWELGVMSAADCCVGNPKGLAYTLPGSDACYMCIGKFKHQPFMFMNT